MEREIIICECHNPEHQLLFTFFEDEPDTIYTEIHLAPRPFWTRVRKAIQYIFGRRSKYGAWDVFEIDRQKFKNALYEQDKTQDTEVQKQGLHVAH